MEINLRIEDVTGGYKIVGRRAVDGVEVGVFIGEAIASTKNQIPARIKTLLKEYFAEPLTP